jgi:hypothetical protein
MPQRPPEMHPLMLLIMYLIGLPRLGLVETDTLFHDRTAGAIFKKYRRGVRRQEIEV